MFPFVLSILSALAFIAGPHVVLPALGLPRPHRHHWMPVVSVALVASSWSLPTVTAFESTSVLVHAFGGGASGAVLTAYLALNLGIERVTQRATLTFALVSTLGVLNELLEFALHTGLGWKFSHDTVVDLAANTAGALITFIAIETLRRLRRTDSPS